MSAQLKTWLELNNMHNGPFQRKMYLEGVVRGFCCDEFCNQFYRCPENRLLPSLNDALRWFQANPERYSFLIFCTDKKKCALVHRNKAPLYQGSTVRTHLGGARLNSTFPSMSVHYGKIRGVMPSVEDAGLNVLVYTLVAPLPVDVTQRFSTPPTPDYIEELPVNTIVPPPLRLATAAPSLASAVVPVEPEDQPCPSESSSSSSSHTPICLPMPDQVPAQLSMPDWLKPSCGPPRLYEFFESAYKHGYNRAATYINANGIPNPDEMPNNILCQKCHENHPNPLRARLVYVHNCAAARTVEYMRENAAARTVEYMREKKQVQDAEAAAEAASQAAVQAALEAANKAATEAAAQAAAEAAALAGEAAVRAATAAAAHAAAFAIAAEAAAQATAQAKAAQAAAEAAAQAAAEHAQAVKARFMGNAPRL
jgi:hypothetical protein